VTYRLTGLLAANRYFVAVAAVDSEGIESACSGVASAVARSVGSAAGLVVGLPASNAPPFANGQPVSTLTGLTADLGPQMPGATASFAASASGGTGPYQFKWWLWDGATWTVLQEWSTSSILAWIPSTSNLNYAVGVWVRSNGNTADQPDGYPASSAGYRSIAFAIN
jgi:ABC-type amino acid transport substrate-binding protein